MENTIENKQKFIAQYWGQPILRTHNFCELVNTNRFQDFLLDDCRHPIHLELTPLASISDEDAIEVAKIYHNEISKNNIPDAQLGRWHVNEFLIELLPSQIDFLRSKGYALPYNGTPVETLIEWGWIKLT